ncbi:MAG: PatB family C-S lyase [Bermanella sp.]
MPMPFGSLVDRRQSDSIKWKRYADKDILPMWVADMDFKVSPEILTAIHERTAHGVLGYGSDNPELLNLIVEHCQHHYQWHIQPEWIVLTPGVVKGLNIARGIAAQRGKPAGITAAPVYPHLMQHAPLLSFEDQTFLSKATGDSWQLDLAQMARNISQDTGVFLLCNPHNPLGKVYSREELMAVAHVCQQHDLIICSDDIHCDLILNGKRHIPIASLSAEIAERCITLMAPSKTFNIAGLDTAFAIISNPAMRKQYQKSMYGLVGHVNIIGTQAAIAAYKYGEPWRQRLIKYLQGNLKLIEQRINSLTGISMRPVEATYLAWLNVAPLQLANPQKYFEDFGVGMSAGSEFADNDYVRLNFGCQQTLLSEALDRIERAVDDRMLALKKMKGPS